VKNNPNKKTNSFVSLIWKSHRFNGINSLEHHAKVTEKEKPKNDSDASDTAGMEA
tara:strand:- start:915 stop:1079 length:165 start_codon:yes stop_codon:yes gene_type:complete